MLFPYWLFPAPAPWDWLRLLRLWSVQGVVRPMVFLLKRRLPWKLPTALTRWFSIKQALLQRADRR
ncbi:hypothetical protein EVA_20199 [gut metagenome]|uniref:Uncharacterized protein n=1 Tax=gut metagenome TaxID=749906 RepID=J9FWH7_9ZZZZ